MRRRVPLQQLRGSDPVLLEVQIQDLLTRPSAQLEPGNLCDLFALAEHATPPKAVVSRLNKFIERAKEEMADLPDGTALGAFIEELGGVDAARIPASFRAHLSEMAQREGRDGAGLQALLESIEATEPTAFELGEGTTHIERAKAAPKAARTSRATGRTPTRKVASKPVVDEEKHGYLCEMVMERIESSANNNLSETVLIAGVRHRAKALYPKMLPQEVNAALADLLKKGLVRKSAGRWSSTRRR